MVTSVLWALTIGMTFILTPQVEASQGPGATKMDAKLGVEVEGPFEMICTFLGRSKKVIIIYRHGPKEWEPKLSCNDGAGSQIARHVPADERDPRLMITGGMPTVENGSNASSKAGEMTPRANPSRAKRLAAAR